MLSESIERLFRRDAEIDARNGAGVSDPGYNEPHVRRIALRSSLGSTGYELLPPFLFPKKQGTRELLREFPTYCLCNSVNLLTYPITDADVVLDAAVASG
jgi:hypothetical protein